MAFLLTATSYLLWSAWEICTGIEYNSLQVAFRKLTPQPIGDFGVVINTVSLAATSPNNAEVCRYLPLRANYLERVSC